jgi:hypothetical protein
MPVIRRDAPGREKERDHVQRFRRIADEIKLAVAILNVSNRIRFEGMDKIRKLQGIPDKENFKVITYQVPVTILRVHLYCKATWIPKCFR